jgi:hypothetical protein
MTPEQYEAVSKRGNVHVLSKPKPGRTPGFVGRIFGQEYTPENPYYIVRLPDSGCPNLKSDGTCAVWGTPLQPNNCKSFGLGSETCLKLQDNPFFLISEL